MYRIKPIWPGYYIFHDNLLKDAFVINGRTIRFFLNIIKNGKTHNI